VDHGSAATSLGLLQGTKGGDAEAWRRLVTLYSPLVAHWCRQWQVGQDDVGDISQEVFQAVATHMAQFRKERPGDTFRGWLRTIAHNKARDYFRKKGREPERDLDLHPSALPAAGPEASADPSEREAETRLLHRALEMIRDDFQERTWQAFWRTAVEGHPAAEVATALSMSAGAVRVSRSRVLQRLREQLGDAMQINPLTRLPPEDSP
jgi:RNA polymerase sigma-70 factor (ECF subfamily)